MYSFELLQNEQIIKKAVGNLTIENTLFTGAFYLTNERMMFVGYLLDQTQKHYTDISLYHIDELRKEKTFRIIPNVLIIHSVQGVEWKVLITGRDSWYEAVQKQISLIVN
jgi:hypothetical protein